MTEPTIYTGIDDGNDYSLSLPYILGHDDICREVTIRFVGEMIVYRYGNLSKTSGQISRRLTDLYVQPILEVGERQFAYVGRSNRGLPMFKENT